MIRRNKRLKLEREKNALAALAMTHADLFSDNQSVTFFRTEQIWQNLDLFRTFLEPIWNAILARTNVAEKFLASYSDLFTKLAFVTLARLECVPGHIAATKILHDCPRDWSLTKTELSISPTKLTLMASLCAFTLIFPYTFLNAHFPREQLISNQPKVSERNAKNPFVNLLRVSRIIYTRKIEDYRKQKFSVKVI